MFKLSSRAGSVSIDGVQIIKSADQTVDAIDNVADDSEFSWGSVYRQDCQAAIRSDVWYHGFSEESDLELVTNKASRRNQLSQHVGGGLVHAVSDSLTHTSNKWRTPADPHTHLNNKNTHLTVLARCKYY